MLVQLSVALFQCDTLAWHEQLEFVMILFALALVVCAATACVSFKRTGALTTEPMP